MTGLLSVTASGVSFTDSAAAARFGAWPAMRPASATWPATWPTSATPSPRLALCESAGVGDHEAGGVDASRSESELTTPNALVENLLGLSTSSPSSLLDLDSMSDSAA